MMREKSGTLHCGHETLPQDTASPSERKLKSRPRRFAVYDADGSGDIDNHELAKLFQDLSSLEPPECLLLPGLRLSSGMDNIYIILNTSIDTDAFVYLRINEHGLRSSWELMGFLRVP